MSHYQNSGCQLPSAFWGLKMHFEKGFESASFGINSIISSINKKKRVQSVGKCSSTYVYLQSVIASYSPGIHNSVLVVFVDPCEQGSF